MNNTIVDGDSTRADTRLLLGEARSSLVRNIIERSGFELTDELKARFDAAGDTPYGTAFASDLDGKLGDAVVDQFLASIAADAEEGDEDEDEDDPDDQFTVNGERVSAETAAEHLVQVSMFAKHRGMDEYARTIERAIVQMASPLYDTGATGEFAAKQKFTKKGVTRLGVIFEEVWSIQVTAKPVK